MLRAIKYIVVIVVAIVVIIAIALAIMVNTINPNRFKPFISNQIYKATGRQATFSGDLSWSILPLSIKVNGMTLSNPSGFNHAPLLTLQQASASVKILPLLVGKIETGKIAVNTVNVRLITDKSGQNNWTLAAPSNNAQGQAEKRPVKSSSKTKSWRISIPHVDLKDINIEWDNRQTGYQAQVKNLNLQAVNAQLRTPFPISGNMSVSSNKYNTTGKIRFEGSVQINTNAQQYALTDLNINSHWQNAALPNGQATLDLKGSITANKQRVALKPLVLTLDGNSIHANASIDQSSGSPDIRFNVTAQRLDLDPYLQAFNQLSSVNSKLEPSSSKTERAGTVSSTTTSQDNQQALLTVLRQLKLSGNVTIARLTAMKVTATDISLTANANQGIITISPVTAKLYNGSYQGSGTIDARGSALQFSDDDRLTNVSVQALLTDIYQFRRLSGAVSAETKLTAQGWTMKQILSSSNGKFQFAIKDGAIEGADANYFFSLLSAKLAGQTLPLPSSDTQTKFAELSASGIVRQGIASSQNILLKSPRLRAAGSAQANLNTQKLSGLLTISRMRNGLSANAEMIKPSIPLKISGSFDKPKFQPDFQKLLQEQVSDSAIKQVKQQVQKGLGRLLGGQ